MIIPPLPFHAYIFDVDNTLTWGNTTTELRPDVATWLKIIQPKKTALATNQGGVGLRYWMQPRPQDGYKGFGNYTQYPTQEEVEKRLKKIATTIKRYTQGEVVIFAAYRYLSKSGNWSPIPPDQIQNPHWSKEWRKPAPGMLLAAAKHYNVQPGECVFIGDTWNKSTSDQEAAAAAGMSFINIEDLIH